MTLLINIQIKLFFKRKFPIVLTCKFGNLVWPNARAALVLSVSPMFYTGFESLNSVDGLWHNHRQVNIVMLSGIALVTSLLQILGRCNG
jgi:hypothetical protein